MQKHSLSYLVPEDKNILYLIKKKPTHFHEKHLESPDFECTEWSSSFLGSETEEYFLSTSFLNLSH